MTPQQIIALCRRSFADEYKREPTSAELISMLAECLSRCATRNEKSAGPWPVKPEPKPLP